VAKTEVKLRVVIAVTDTTPVARIWEAALHLLRESPADLVALYVEDDRWHRIASLPFTREISRSGGVPVEFTRQRAEQVSRERAARVQELIEKLAAKSNLEPAFEVLSESDAGRLREFIGSHENILVAPSSNWWKRQRRKSRPLTRFPKPAVRLTLPLPVFSL
jgi:hypothetical protein